MICAKPDGTSVSLVYILASVYVKLYTEVMRMNKLVIRPNKYGGKSSVVSARIPDEMLAQLDDLSAKTGRSRNELLVTMIEFALDHIEIDYTDKK